jgi:eukaryotic-like serine/threonine-protein kinase
MTGPGTTIAGRYRVLHQLGMGGMGSVWLARDTSLDRHVAVKSVRASLGTDGTDGGPSIGEQRAMREARLIARVNHSHAVAIYDVVTHEHQPWLVMEYVPSQNLSELVRRHGPLAPERAAEIGAQVASALVDAHRAGIVHRDVKPANVLMAEDGSAKITDFGIARGLDDVTLTATGAMWGTPAYFAPEVASGSAPTEKADVWSLGATLYFAVEGAPPYGTDGGALVLLGRIARRPVPPPTRAGSLTSVLSRLLDRDPDNRPTMAEAARMLGARRPWHDDTRVIVGFAPSPADGDAPAHAAEPAYADAPVDTPGHIDTPTPDSPSLLPPAAYGVPGEPGKPGPRRRAPVVALLALALLVAVAGLLWLAGGDGAQRPVADTSAEPPSPAARPSEPSSPQPGASARDSGGGGRQRSTRTERRERPGHPGRSPARGSAFTPAAMEGTVADYYALMPADTRSGFSLLGPSLRSQGFESYDDFWDSIDSVDVRGLQADPSSRTVEGTVVFVTDDGRISTEQHRFGLVKDPSGGGLLIDTDDMVG